MKALTLWQPYATLIADGYKTIETRDWRPHDSLVGERVAIHAGSKCVLERHMSSELAVFLRQEYRGPDWSAWMPQGAVVATARLAGVEPSDGRERDIFGDYGYGRFLWRLDDVRKVNPPLLIRGHQRLWNLDDTLLRE